MEKGIIRVAILDLNNGQVNQGMRCIREILETVNETSDVELKFDEFDVRGKNEIADLSYDVYIGTGGPGSPLTSEGEDWETSFFGLMDGIKKNNDLHPDQKKQVFLICHSFQIYCRYYGFGRVTKRHSYSFGVMPIHKTAGGSREPLFSELEDPFWAVDSREYQVTKPNLKRIRENGGEVLCIEKYRPAEKYERCIMAIRFSDSFFGVQFHPEADSIGMLHYMKMPERKEQVINAFGEEKYNSMLIQLDDPEKILLTHDTILPLFLQAAINSKQELILR